MSVFRFMKTYDLRQTMEDRPDQKRGYGHVLDYNRLYDLAHQRQVYHSSHFTETFSSCPEFGSTDSGLINRRLDGVSRLSETENIIQHVLRNYWEPDTFRFRNNRSTSTSGGWDGDWCVGAGCSNSFGEDTKPDSSPSSTSSLVSHGKTQSTYKLSGNFRPLLPEYYFPAFEGRSVMVSNPELMNIDPMLKRLRKTMSEPITSMTPPTDKPAAFLTSTCISYTRFNGRKPYLLKSQDDMDMFSVSSGEVDRNDSDDSQKLAYFGK